MSIVSKLIYNRNFLSNFFNYLVRLDNKVFFQFYYLQGFGMRSPFFFSFLRSWVILLNKLCYNYINIGDLNRYIANHNLFSSSFFSVVKLFLHGKLVHFRRKFNLYPLNRQLYLRSKIYGGFRDLGKSNYSTVLRFRKKRIRSVVKKRVGRWYKGHINFLRKRFKKSTYKGSSTRFGLSRYKFFDNRFLLLKKSFYFFILNNRLKRSRKLFVKFFRDHIIRSLSRRIFYIRRLNKLRKNLTNNFRDLFMNRRFLVKLQRLYIRVDSLNFPRVFLALVKLYLQYRARTFLIWVSLVLPKVAQCAAFFSLSGFRGNKFSQIVYGVDYKLEPISAFLGIDPVSGKGSQHKFIFKKSFFYFFKDPHKKIKKRFFIKIKKIKKRFFKQIWKSTKVSLMSEAENGKIGGIFPLNNKIQRKGLAFSRYFLRKRDFCNSIRKKRNRIISPSFTFFGQKFTGKKNDLKVLTLIRSIYRVGTYRLCQILLKFRRNQNMRLFNLRGRFRVNLEIFLRTLILGESFKRLEDDNFNKKLAVRSYHSMRFRLNLPIRGQRTHSNAGTPKRLRKHSPVKRF